MPLAIAVFLLSAAALAAEVLLMRLFSIAEWHHFAWMVISLALLGYAAAGTFVALVRRQLLRHVRATLIAAALGSAVALLASVSLVPAAGFNSLEIVWDPRQTVRLFCIYLVLSIPFFAIGVFMATIFTAARGAVPRLYRADLLGAGFGAMASVGLLFVVRPDVALRCVSAAAALAGTAVALTCRGRARWAAGSLGIACIVISVIWPAAPLRPAMSPYKDLPQALRIRGARVVLERSGPQGLIDVVANDIVPFRHAPGLSLIFADDIPPQLQVFIDGAYVTSIPAPERRRLSPAYTAFQTRAAAHALREVRDTPVLVIGADVTAIVDALSRGARSIDVVEPNVQLIDLLQHELAARNAALSDRRIRFASGNPRAFLLRSTRRWRLIEVSFSGGGGEAGLRENYLLTTEGLRLLANRLERRGIVSMTGPVRMPPNEMMKLVMAIAAANAPNSQENTLAVIRGWDVATALYGRDAFSADDLDRLARFAEARWFDFDVPPHAGRPSFNALDRPYLIEAANAVQGGISARDDFLSRYKFDLAPATDSRPFFFHFFRWRALPELLTLRNRGGAPLLEGGTLAVVATLVQAIVATALLVLLPLALRSSHDRASEGGIWRVAVYFGGIGLGFLFLEIAFLQRFALLLAHPLYASSVILGSLLVWAGIGSGLARRVAPDNLRVRAAALIAIAILAVLYAGALRPLFAMLAPASEPAKVLASVFIVAPIAVLMGIPFPLGIAHFGGMHRGWIAWAWAINGSASVVSAVAAMLIATSLGIETVMIAAAVFYAIATVALAAGRAPLER